MGDDLSTGIKIGISAVVIVAILTTIIAVIVLAKIFAGRYVTDLSTRTNPNYVATVKDLALEQRPVPAPSIYVALANYGEENIVQFDIDIDGVPVINDSLDMLLAYSEKQLYLRVVQADDGLHVWVGDNEITNDGWVVIH